MRFKYLYFAGAILVVIAGVLFLSMSRDPDEKDEPILTNSASRYAADYEKGVAIYKSTEDESAVITLARHYSRESNDKLYEVLAVVPSESASLYFVKEKYSILLYYSQLKNREDDYKKYRLEFREELSKHAQNSEEASKLLSSFDRTYPEKNEGYVEKEGEEIIP